MKIILIFGLAFLVGCTSPEVDSGSTQAKSGAMTGTKVEGSTKAYLEMCKRDPESVLCPEKENEQ